MSAPLSLSGVGDIGCELDLSQGLGYLSDADLFTSRLFDSSRVREKGVSVSGTVTVTVTVTARVTVAVIMTVFRKRWFSSPPGFCVLLE